MTKETLLKFKAIYEKNHDKHNLARINKSLLVYEKKPEEKNILEKISEEKKAKK